MATTEVVRLVNDPEGLVLNGKPATKLRFVIKAPGKDYKDRFVNGLQWGKDAATAARLRKGDLIQVTGQLALGGYHSKKLNGQWVDQDEMGFGWRIERVVKSDSFFGGAAPADGTEGADAATSPEPQGTAGRDPLDEF